MRQFPLKLVSNDDDVFSIEKRKKILEDLTDKAIEILGRTKKLNPTSKYIFMYDGHQLATNTFNKRLKSIAKT